MVTRPIRPQLVHWQLALCLLIFLCPRWFLPRTLQNVERTNIPMMVDLIQALPELTISSQFLVNLKLRTMLLWLLYVSLLSHLHTQPV